jgi:hypothetical protein
VKDTTEELTANYLMPICLAIQKQNVSSKLQFLLNTNFFLQNLAKKILIILLIKLNLIFKRAIY